MTLKILSNSRPNTVTPSFRSNWWPKTKNWHLFVKPPKYVWHAYFMTEKALDPCKNVWNYCSFTLKKKYHRASFVLHSEVLHQIYPIGPHIHVICGSLKFWYIGESSRNVVDKISCKYIGFETVFLVLKGSSLNLSTRGQKCHACTCTCIETNQNNWNCRWSNLVTSINLLIKDVLTGDNNKISVKY